MNEFDDMNIPADFDDLSKYAPTLAKLRGGEEGFVLPEGYFESLSDEIVSGFKFQVSSSENGFVVPGNYFENLADQIVSNVEFRVSSSENGFVVPGNYFKNLTDEIISKTNLDELTQNSKPETDFVVPTNYFDKLDSELNTKLALDNLKQDEGFNVPENYFDKLSDRITSRAALDETLLKSSEVPAGYFDSLADRITDRIQKEEGTGAPEQKERGRVIVFAEVIKRYSRPAAIAASVALVIAAAFWFLNREDGPKKNQMADVIQPKQIQQPTPPVKKDTTIDIIVPEKNNNVVQETPKAKNNVPHKVNHKEREDVQVVKNDIMEQVDQIDMNTVADFVADNSDLDFTDQQIISDPSIEKYFNDNSELNDIIDGINE